MATVALSLDQLTCGRRARIVSLDEGDATSVRLMEMGVTPGEVVESLGFAPFGDPLAIHVRGSRLALRSHQARKIQVELVEL